MIPSDDYHPCQALADVLTIKEHFGKWRGLKLALIGDGNNVANSLMITAMWHCSKQLGAFPAVLITVKRREFAIVGLRTPRESLGAPGEP